MKKWCSAFLLMIWLPGAAQLPETDIWLLRVTKDKKTGQLSLAAPTNITNRKGYENQPAFSPDGKVIYYARHDGSQSDIYAYDIRKKKTRQVTHTQESEFSPRIRTGTDHLTAVVIERDSSQRMHVIDAKTGALVSRLPPDSIGYYTFLNRDTAVFYKVTDPPVLQWCKAEREEEHYLASDPVRTFWPVNRHVFIFGIRDSTIVRYLIYDFALAKAREFARHAHGSENIWWHKELGLLISVEDKILKFEETKKEWITLFGLNSFGIKKISRFAFDPSGKYLTLVQNISDN